MDSNANNAWSQTPCTECQYWPIYPCYSAARPMVDCVAEYTNDYISVAKEDPSESTAENMYERLVDEGHDARLLRFSPSDDGTIAGGHKDPKNTMYWIAGCLGITDPCDQACETAFIGCVESGDVSTASNRVDSFENCMKPTTFAGLGCAAECSPTYNMLTASEVPTTALFDNFGAGSGVASAAPGTSLCNAN